MSRSLARHWAAAEHGAPDIVGCEVERVKYRPGRNCVVGYRVHVKWPRRPGRAGRRHTSERLAATRVCAAMYPSGEVEARYERVLAAHGSQGLAPPVSLLREPGVLLWRFPHDRKLRGLPLLTDADWLRGHAMPELVARHWGSHWRIDSARHELRGYFPHHSATLRSQLHLRDEQGGSQQTWVIYGKARADDEGPRVHDAMARLHASDACRAGAVGYARPLALHRDEGLLWQEGIDAPTLDRCLQEGPVDAARWAHLALALAALHGTPLGLEPTITHDSLRVELERATRTLCVAVPEIAPCAQGLHAVLQRNIDTVDCAADATLHGDLHSKNILLGADRVHFIDFDRVGAGPRLAEVGTLLAELILRDCVAGRAVAWSHLASLARAYDDARGVAADPWQRAWHVATALLCQPAHRCVTSLKPGRLEVLPSLLEAARAVLAGQLQVARS